MADPVTIQDIYELFKVSQAEADRRAAEADQRAAEADRSMEELRRIVANTSREVSRLGDRWGLFVENLVAPAVQRLFQERGIDIQQTYRRAKSTRPEAPMEIDILAVNGDVAVAIEVKSRLTQEDVDTFCTKLERFKLAFPERVNDRILGAVAAIEFVQEVDRYAYRKGLFVMRQCGDSMELANNATFQPKSW